MNFSHLLQELGTARGRDAWIAISRDGGETAQVAVLHGSLGAVGVPEEGGHGAQEPVAFVPVEIPGEPDLSERIGVALDPAEFEGAEGALPGDLFVRFRDFNVRVATR